MTFWMLVGLMVVAALSFVVLPIIKPGIGKKPQLLIVIAIAVPIAAILGYQKLGTPTATNLPVSSMPPMPSGAMPPGHPSKAMNMDLGQLADKLAEKLKANPDNAEGWALLARTYVETKRYKEAVPAFEKAATLIPKDPQLLTDYADALAMNNGGFDKKSESMVDQALAIDPNHVKALMLRATINFNRKDYQKAIDSWEKILKLPGLDAERTKEATGSIEEARRMMSAGKK